MTTLVLRRLGTLASVAALAATLAFVCPAPGHAAASHAATVADRRTEYEAALDRVSAVSAQHARLVELAATAEQRAEELRAAVGDDSGGLVDAISGFFTREPSELDRAAEAAENAEDARELADLVHAALVQRIAEAEGARRAWERAERRRSREEAALTASEYADRAIAYAQLPAGYAVTDPDQDRRNREALAAWHDYLRSLATAAVVPPSAAELADPGALPAGLDPARDRHNDTVPGVAVAEPAQGHEVTVLSAETVRAVSEAFRRLGVPTEGDPTAYACGGLVADAWTGPQVHTPADAIGQWETLPVVGTDSTHAGDIVVLGKRGAGLGETAVQVGAGQVVAADPTTGVAEVRTLETAPLGVRRIGIAPSEHRTAPEGGTCGVAPVATVGDGPFVLPVPAGTYALTAAFGDAGSHWSSGAHTGLDFAAPTGTPVVAAAAGTVAVEHPAWAGTLVRIDHGNGLETWYAHLSRTDVATGQVLAAGDLVGAVGARGNTTGPHLHFEVRLDGAPYDPAPLLGLTEALR